MTKARDLADLGGVTTRLDEVGNTDGALSNRNLIINGGMQVWQRGTSNASVSNNTYPAADRWKFWNSGAAVGTTRTEFTAGQTGVSNLDYYNSVSIGTNSAVSDFALFTQHIENVKTSSDQTFTLSFYAKASQSWTIGIEPIQNFGIGGSERVLGTTETVTVGTSWARHTVTLSTASISGKTLGVGHNFEFVFWLTAGSDVARAAGIGNQTGTFDITGVQLEAGDTATPFEHRSYGDELARCQRYYEDHTDWIHWATYTPTSLTVNPIINYAVKKIAAPSVTIRELGGTLGFQLIGGGPSGFDFRNNNTYVTGSADKYFTWTAEAEL